MKDIITYAKNSKTFLAEAIVTLPARVIYDESKPPKAVSVSLTKTPTIRSADGTLALVRCSSLELADLKKLKSLVVLSEVAAGGDYLKAMSKSNRVIYDSVHDQSPVAVMDDKGKPMLDAKGKPVMYTPPAEIGRFA